MTTDLTMRVNVRTTTTSTKVRTKDNRVFAVSELVRVGLGLEKHVPVLLILRIVLKRSNVSIQGQSQPTKNQRKKMV